MFVDTVRQGVPEWLVVAILLKSYSLALLRCLIWHLCIFWQLAFLILIIKICKHQRWLVSRDICNKIFRCSTTQQAFAERPARMAAYRCMAGKLKSIGNAYLACLLQVCSA